MPRFYIPSISVSTSSCSLPLNIARHIQVLRHQPGDTIELFDGHGYVYSATIVHMGKKNVDVVVDKKIALSLESPLNITLIQSISSSDHMDMTIQKSVELGVYTIQPIITARSSQNLTGQRAQKKIQRWQEIAIASCEQNGRTYVPTIAPILPFDIAIPQYHTKGLNILMSPNQPTSLKQLPIPTTYVNLLIGPEGGFTAAEEAIFKQQYHFHAISLGPRILRTETASLASIATMQMLWGDF